MQDAFVSLKAAQLLAVFLTTQQASRDYDAPPKDALLKLLEFIDKQLKAVANGSGDDGSEGNAAPISLAILGEILRQAPFRATVWAQASEAKDGNLSLVATLVNLVQTTSGAPGSGSSTPREAGGKPQLQYQALFALWILTFDKQAASGIDAHFGLASALASAAQAALKHKIVRLIVGIWRNMLAADDENASRLLGAKVLPLCQTLEERNYSDQELTDDLKYVSSALSKRLDEMNSYEEYISELHSKHLTFDNPVHTLEDFWKENAEKLVEHDGKELKELVALVKPEAHSDATTLAVACSDLGKFVHFYDGGRRRVVALGGKDAIMGLVDHDDSQVKHYALQTLARLVSTSWR